MKSLERAVDYADGLRELHESGTAEMPNPQSIFRRFLSVAGLDERRLPESTREETMRNFGAFSDAISAWDRINFWPKQESKLTKLVQYLGGDGRFLFDDGVGDSQFANLDAVTITTVHQAKGREWPVVFMPALVGDLFPQPERNYGFVWDYVPRNAIEDPHRYDDSVENEARLFYVGMTRSKKFLHFSGSPTVDGRGKPLLRQSQFMADVVRSPLVSRSEPDYSSRARLTDALEPEEPAPQVLDVELSFSELKFLLECPYKFKLLSVYGFRDALGGPMGFGRSLHNALAEIHGNWMMGFPVGQDAAPDFVDRHLLLRYADNEVRDRMRTAALGIVNDYLSDYARDHRRVQSPERDIAVHLDGGITVKGRVDLVREDDDGRVTIVDFKTNSRSQPEDVTRDQLLTYALGYRELTGQDASFIETYALEDRDRAVEAVEEPMLRDLEARIQAAVAGFRENRLEPAPEREKCRGCNVRDLCPAGKALVPLAACA